MIIVGTHILTYILCSSPFFVLLLLLLSLLLYYEIACDIITIKSYKLYSETSNWWSSCGRPITLHYITLLLLNNMNDDIRDAICLRPFACGLHIMNPNRLSTLTTKGRREQNPVAILCIASVVLRSAKADRARSSTAIRYNNILLYYNIIV